MSRMKSVFFGLMMTVFAAAAFAQNAGDFNVELTKDGKGAILTGYTGTERDVKIPAQIEGLPVREIRALKSGVIRSLVIPDTVTIIGENAFAFALVSVTIPDSVTSIGKSAFSGNTNLESIILPDGITFIQENLFEGCTALATVILPSNVTAIGYRAFYNCSSLKSVNLPDTVDTIWDSAFEGCSSLASINLPASVTKLGKNVFAATALTSITLPPNVEEIPQEAFYNCANLAAIVFGDKLQTIGDDAFAKCPAITSITIPDSITTLLGSKESPFPAAKLNLTTQARLRNITWLPDRYYYYNLGMDEYNRYFRYEQRDYLDRALSYFNQQLQFTPDHAGTYAMRGAVYQAKGDSANALTDNKKALQLDPKNTIAPKFFAELAEKQRAEQREAEAEKRRAEQREAEAEKRRAEAEKTVKIVKQLEPLERELSTLQGLKKLNSKQYAAFEEIFRKYYTTIRPQLDISNVQISRIAEKIRSSLESITYALSESQKKKLEKALLAAGL